MRDVRLSVLGDGSAGPHAIQSVPSGVTAAELVFVMPRGSAIGPRSTARTGSGRRNDADGDVDPVFLHRSAVSTGGVQPDFEGLSDGDEANE